MIGEENLFTAEQSNSGGEGAAFAGAEGGLGVGGVDHAVYYIGIAAAGDVVEASAESEVVAQEMKTLFELEIQR